MSNEWYTPAKYIEAARAVMGSIDLDPASCELANQTVRATRYYTQEENGLAQEWYGNVWLNPPYNRTPEMKAKGQSSIWLFLSKLLQEYYSGNVEQAIFLGTGEINGQWFQPLWEHTICFPDHKVHFILPFKRSNYANVFGTTFAYIGGNEQAFIEQFSQFGRIAKAVDVPARDKVRQLELVS